MLQPLAIAMIGGMLASMPLSLLVIPTLYYHENAAAQASSLHADKKSALHFHRDGCANVHDNSSEMTNGC
ncbi:MAG: efflux RND transporter permease subunit, partial [candidate division KSB1 bacterium]|nr:efflux RND transporter permease subunit [candidate division KSB1 bacterium]